MLRIRSNVKAMAPYSPGKPIEEVKRELNLTDVVKLASNENPLGPSPKAIEAVRAAASEMHIYPDASGFNLKKALSERFAVATENIMIGNGSDELIHLLGLILLEGQQDEIIVGDPSFVRYDAAAHLSDAKLVKVALDASLTHDLDAMLAAITPNTRMIWIANPNNPTGTIVRRQAFESFLKQVPSHVAVVLDEAYYEFARHDPDYPVSLDYFREYPNVIGLRTFSKAYGLAGIRLGFGFASAEVVDAINRAREPFNTNALGQVAAIAALGDDSFIEASLKVNQEGRDRISEAFRQVGAKPVESYANFVCADLGRPAEPVFQALLRKGVIVRSGHVLGLPTYLRVSVGTPGEVGKFVEAFTEVMAGAAWA